MIEKLAYWTSIFLSVASVVLLVTNIILIENNRSLQEDVTHRQTIINDGVNLSQFNQGLTKTLISLATKNNDRDLRTLLTTQGIAIDSSSEQPNRNGSTSTSESTPTKK